MSLWLAVWVGCTHHIAEVPALAPAPPVAPVPGLVVCWVETATGNLPKGLVVAHHALGDDVVSTQGGLLIVHPTGGAWLVDGGMSVDPLAHLDEVRGLTKVLMRSSVKDWARRTTLADAVRAFGVAPAALAGAVVTHGHYDHLGGLTDLPELPIFAGAEEVALASKASIGDDFTLLPEEARSLLPRAREIAFDDGPAGPWTRSWDLFGDGAVRVVPMPGHTPGSVGVWVTLADGRQLFDVGDTVWVREGFEQREPKAWPATMFDSDGDATDVQIARLWALHQANPALTILPAHDRRQWEAAFSTGPCVR